ncbi:ribosome maturation factor RimM [Lactobacillus helveticus]|uniref:Ribosome maturation factor RimM n=2 Tax=Lactobacillus helveticus TaxID=1587 RepID=U4QFX8_LACHE|nr:ribosome maturation factor RimM [Lactobacillus helveticus]ADX70002.1 Ribosome maturation factor rimM [Lactobacillus helveticus H10]ALI52397.1 16S rRNA processing protein RimM [Lactobacillus helveticus]NRN71938.1 Ribosome maturation factor RimM [Lactobacillus helveticus]NRN73882.1 Ribosome maturation factor RimM [Lactobacillus helveticus]NRN75804.1 Ribosome maturation factor RimM [Lactobacillus helveticus]
MEYFDVARILTTHRLNGEVKVNVITDFPEERFAEGMHLSLRSDTNRTLTVEKSRPFKQFWLIQFKEITDIDQAEKLRGQILVVSEEDRGELPDGVYYYKDIFDCDVIDEETGKRIGKIVDIQSPGANDIWLVREDDVKEYWIPNIADVVKKVDVAAKKVYVELMEGLRDED